MAQSLVRDGLRVQQWDDKFFREYVRDNKFAPYMGTNEAAVIQMKENLTKTSGDSITFQMIGRLQNAGVRGANSLRGNEEAMNNRSQRVFVELVRNGVSVDTKTEQIKTDIDLRNAGRALLKDWAIETLRNDVIAAMMSIDGVAFATSTAAQRNTWVTNNSDRVLFGRTRSNLVAGNHASSLANITAAGGTITAGTISLLKRIAKTASPRIRPIRTKNDEEWFIYFANPLVFRDLKADSTMLTSNREAWVRGADNPIFTDGDLIYDGVIIKEIEDIPAFPGLGAASAQVAPGFLCGAQSVGVGIAQRTRSVEDEPQDYGRILGIGVEEIRGVQKLRFGTGASDTDSTRDFGIVTHWSAAAADA